MSHSSAVFVITELTTRSHAQPQGAVLTSSVVTQTSHAVQPMIVVARVTWSMHGVLDAGGGQSGQDAANRHLGRARPRRANRLELVS